MWWILLGTVGSLVATYLYLFCGKDIQVSQTRYCLRCNGTGRAVRRPFGWSRCPLCDGTGRRPRNEGAWQ
jgi:DnaJ-class molecular chaperone